MEAICIMVAGPPVAKGRPRIGRGPAGRPMAFTPAHTRKYEQAIRIAAAAAMDGRAPLDEAVEMTVLVVLPIPMSMSRKRQREALAGLRLPTKRPDLDNFLKTAADGCAGVVFRDDSLIIKLIATKRYGSRPRLEITVEPLVGKNTEGAD